MNTLTGLEVTVTASRAWKAFVETLAAATLFLCMVAFGHCGKGCKPPQSAAEVEAAYTAELLACSEKAATKADAKSCRHDVNTKYGLCERDSWPRITPCDE